MNRTPIQLTSEKGLSMPVVVMVILIVTILGAVLYSFSQNQLLSAARGNDARQAEYLARSGIEAAIEWWKQETTKPQGTKNFDRVYMREDGTMVLTDPGDSKVGYIDVSVTRQDDGTWSIQSTGNANTSTKTVKYSSSMLMENEDLEGLWYAENGVILPGPNIQSVKINNVSRNIYVHDEIAGVAVVGRPGTTLRLNKDNNEHSRVSFGARALYFDSYMDLSINDDKVGFLIAAGEKIVFNDTLKIRINADGGGGVLILYLPEGLGIPGQELITSDLLENADAIDPNAKYGYVYFKEIIGIRDYWLWTAEDTVASNKAYYFTRKNTEDEKQNGIVIINLDDLFDNFNDGLNNLISSEVLIPAKASVSKPEPDDCIVFFRN